MLVIKLSLTVGHQGTLSTLTHWVHKAHAPKWYLLAAAPVAEAFPTAAAVMLMRVEVGQ